jgi:hypothetical protein
VFGKRRQDSDEEMFEVSDFPLFKIWEKHNGYTDGSTGE